MMDYLDAIMDENPYSRVSGSYVRTNKLVLLGLNTLFLLQYVIKDFSLLGLGAFMVLSLALFLILFKSSDEYPAAAYIPVLLLFDALIYLCIHFSSIVSGFDMIKHYLGSFKRNSLILFAVGFVVSIIGNSKKLAILSGIGGIIAVGSVVLGLFSNCMLRGFAITDAGKMLLNLIIWGGAIWIVLIRLIFCSVPEKSKLAVWMGFLLAVLSIAFLIIGMPYIASRLDVWSDSIWGLSKGAFAYWKTIIAFVLSVVCIFLLYFVDGKDGSHLSVDTYVVIIIAETIAAIRILLSAFFSYCWILPFLLIIGTIWSMNNDYSGKKTMGLSSIVFNVIQFALFCLTVVFLRSGLWLNVMITVLFVMFLYISFSRNDASAKVKCIAIEVAIALEAAALMWMLRFSLSGLLIIIFAFAVSVAVTVVLFAQNPCNIPPSDGALIAICVALFIVCFLPLLKYGTKISKQYDDEGVQTITITPRGKENEVEQAYYYWRDQYGQIQDERVEIKGNEIHVNSSYEILSVVTVDKYGVMTKAVFWYPHWLIDSTIP